MHQFVGIAKEQCEILEGMHKRMSTSYQKMAKYFCFDSKKYTMDEFFGDIKTFIDGFVVGMLYVFSSKCLMVAIVFADLTFYLSFGVMSDACDVSVTFIVIVQQASKDNAKEKEAVEKAKRAKEAQEKRERERQEKIARTNALVDINGGKSLCSFFPRMQFAENILNVSTYTFWYQLTWIVPENGR